jgi:tetratricopeptide (TPR) repeat protein
VGLLHLNQKKYEEAAEDMERALRKNARFFQAYGPLAQAHHGLKNWPKFAEARRRAKEFYAKNPDPDLAGEFRIVWEKLEGWNMLIWEKIAPEIESPVEKGDWIYLARFDRADSGLRIQYALIRKAALQAVILRTVVRPSDQRHLENAETLDLADAHEFERFYRRVIEDAASVRARH